MRSSDLREGDEHYRERVGHMEKNQEHEDTDMASARMGRY